MHSTDLLSVLLAAIARQLWSACLLLMRLDTRQLCRGARAARMRGGAAANRRSLLRHTTCLYMTIFTFHVLSETRVSNLIQRRRCNNAAECL